MKKFKCVLFTFVLAYSLAAVVVVHAQDDQSGFISIDCGLPKGSDYTDYNTGINYTSDAGFITSGESNILSNSLLKQFSTVRSFPQGIRNCYTLKPSQGKGSKWLIRARFMYGNYDNKNQSPIFNINIGVDTWGTISFDDASTTFTKEIIHTLSSDYIHVCLIKTGLGTPFISTLELRPLNSTSVMYRTDYGSLVRFKRRNFVSFTTTETIRYKDDEFDRIWVPETLSNTKTISTSLDVKRNSFQLPSAVMRTANMADNVDGSIYYSWDADNVTDQFYIAVHFAELQLLSSNELREFNIYLNKELWCSDGLVVPGYLTTTTCYSDKPRTDFYKYELYIIKTENSTLPPFINALEIYNVKQFSNLETNENDVDAIISIKSIYEVTRDWQGDPCVPEAFVWEGLNCSYKDLEARIISLDLSNSGLTRVIDPSISNLTKLKSLDLSNNNLTGQVPDFLSQLTSLSVLNLKGNNFTGPVPALLLERSKNELLSLSFDGQLENNTNPCQSTPCKKKKSKSVLPIVISVVAAVVLLAAIPFGIWMIRRRKQQVNITKAYPRSTKKVGEIERKGRQFAHSEVLNITNNFQTVLGKGGFGTVYRGCVDGTQVAVKMVSSSSYHGYKGFQAEASLLMSVHHKNLTSLVGYCNEGNNMGIIYEYMANGNLDEHLSGKKSSTVLGWEERLRIAIDAAQGLEYLHHGCKPPIIHRDVKTSNILLTENFQAKLADFGLSRAYPVEGGTHVSTSVVAGTPGYLDPDCYTSNRLTEKSDVYSFGIVLLELITGQPPVSRNQEDKTDIVQWVDSFVQNGDVKQVVDSRLRGDFDVNSVWRAVELAMACASRNSAKRPTMNSVVVELKDCLAIAERASRGQVSKNSYGVTYMNMESDTAPMAR